MAKVIVFIYFIAFSSRSSLRTYCPHFSQWNDLVLILFICWFFALTILVEAVMIMLQISLQRGHISMAGVLLDSLHPVREPPMSFFGFQESAVRLPIRFYPRTDFLPTACKGTKEVWRGLMPHALRHHLPLLVTSKVMKRTASSTLTQHPLLSPSPMALLRATGGQNDCCLRRHSRSRSMSSLLS